MQIAKTMIKLGGSESSLGAQVNLLILSCYGSNKYFTDEQFSVPFVHTNCNVFKFS